MTSVHTSSSLTLPSVDPHSPWQVHAARIVSITPEASDVATYALELKDPLVAASYRFEPGQFNMLYVPGVGEAAISISSDAHQPQRLLHTIRAVGNVTHAIARYQVGDTILLRGPFGTAWPCLSAEGQSLMIAAGGLGLAPLRPVIYHVMRHRDRFDRVWLLYGARTPRDCLFPTEYAQWQAGGLDVRVTVDLADDAWQGSIGVVPTLLEGLQFEPTETHVMTCGPEVMMRFVASEALARGIAPSRLHVSLERNMSCALGHCGHCQFGPAFICKDGPVFSYETIGRYLHVEDL